MDESYLKFARSLMTLGETLGMFCESFSPAVSKDPRVGTLRSCAHQFSEFGTALETSRIDDTALVADAKDLDTASIRVERANQVLHHLVAIGPSVDDAFVAEVDSALTGLETAMLAFLPSDAAFGVLPGRPRIKGVPPFGPNKKGVLPGSPRIRGVPPSKPKEPPLPPPPQTLAKSLVIELVQTARQGRTTSGSSS